MTSEQPPIRVKQLARALNGADPFEYILALIDAGYDRFYVGIPNGFHCDFREPRFVSSSRVQEMGGQASPHPGNSPAPSYLQLNRAQVQELLEHRPITLQAFNEGALFRRRRNDGRPSVEFDYQRIRLGTLEPNSAIVANDTPMVRDVAPENYVVAKAYMPNSNIYCYALQGIDFTRIYVEDITQEAVSDLHEKDSRGVTLLTIDERPEDPYGLEESSPLIYAVLECAYANREKKRSELNSAALVAGFRELNRNYRKNPKPFNDGRDKFAANLANPRYQYNAERTRQSGPAKASRSVPPNPFLQQRFINKDFSKVLYAACCWKDALPPELGQDPEKLVDLLVELGFFDADDNDQVQAAVFLITGTKYRREAGKSYFRHERKDRR